MNRLFFTLTLLVITSNLSASAIELKEGLVIRSSATIIAKTYYLNAAANLKNPLIIVDGKDIELDFSYAVLQGSNNISGPDEMYGLALYIKKGSSNITIKNAIIRGFKIAIMGEDVLNINIINCNLSYNYRQHLKSNLIREDISDWMSYHKNENDEWLRYGAGIYLKNCRGPVIKNNVVTNGQCGLMLVCCQNAEITDNNFSFNSGIGIGLYRSSFNNIVHNRLDYNVRGYSFGKYKRGQDSAGLLLFEQCNSNLIAFNSATHSGDGFFLWAGQSTMDTGEGGSNENFVFGNDFSYAPTNGIEITFSKNLIMQNTIKDCDHGLWGGYSYDTDITDNVFANNRIGIAIEHGQNINIALNKFTGEKTGIKLWSREKQPEDWIYAKKRNTESRNYWIAANQFSHVGTAFDIMGTDTVVLSGNAKLATNEILKLGERVSNMDTSTEGEILDMDYQPDARLKKITYHEAPLSDIPRGKNEMRITEWGPYNFEYPILWLQNTDSMGIKHFEILGKAGNWAINKIKGFELLAQGGNSFPSGISLKTDSSVTERILELVYDGPPHIKQLGDSSAKTSDTFSYHEFDPAIEWKINWYQWDAAHHPANGYLPFTEIFQNNPFLSKTSKTVDFTWWGAIEKNLPADSFATVAETHVLLKENT
ncbi:MAG: hypothetical protein RLZZ28_1093, partial [Bacteroidota bacterium]